MQNTNDEIVNELVTRIDPQEGIHSIFMDECIRVSQQTIFFKGLS